MNEVRVSAVVMRDAHGRVLNVRKRNTSVFMLPGGKPQVGETPQETALREFSEELGISLDPEKLDSLGEFRADAANEAGYTVVAQVFTHPYLPGAEARSEIVELEWVDPAATHKHMAPLNSGVIFPRLVAADTVSPPPPAAKTDKLEV